MQYRYEQSGEALLCEVCAGLFEQGDKLLELVEDQERPVLLARGSDPLIERLHREHGPGRRVSVRAEYGGEHLPVVVGGGDPLDHELLPVARLHPEPLGLKALRQDLGDQAGVDQR